MTCLSNLAVCPLPSHEMMITKRLSLEEREEEGKKEVERECSRGENGNGYVSSERRNTLEKVFPVYASGILGPDAESQCVVSSDDPIWDAVREEAKLEAEREPILSSFLYASILSHDCLEQALSFVLANRLHNSTLFATQLVDIFNDVMMTDKGIQRSIRLDVQAFKDRDPACISYCTALLYFKGYHALQSHRVAHALWKQGRKVLALAIQSRISEVFGIDIHPAARIGDGILLDHGTGVVIGETTVVGNRVSLMQGVTLGGTGKMTGDRHPKIGDGVLIGANVNILGNIKIREGAMVAAASLVLKDVPPHSIVAGNPARVIGFVNEQAPALTMKHDASKNFFEKIAIDSGGRRSTGVKICEGVAEACENPISVTTASCQHSISFHGP